MTDPFTTITKYLVQLFRASPLLLAAGIKDANVIDVTDKQWSATSPLDDSPSAGQLPEIIIVPSRYKFFPYQPNSRTTSAAREFLICVTTNTLRAGNDDSGVQPATIFPLEWAMLRTLGAIPPDMGFDDPTTLAVRKYTIEAASDKGLIDSHQILARSNRVWVGIISLWADMYWSSSAINPANP